MAVWKIVFTVVQLLTPAAGFQAIPSHLISSSEVNTLNRNYRSAPTLTQKHVTFAGLGQTSTRLHLVENINALSSLYKASLETNPLQTKLVTGAILAVCGDAIAQLRDPGDYDLRRATSFASFDAIYRALQVYLFPIIVLQFHGQHLESIMPSIDLEVLGPIEQTMVNQFLVIPFLYYPIFYSFTGIMQGLPMDEIIERGCSTFWPTLKRNWLFWLPVQYYQFSYVDEPLQIPFLCVVGLIWTIILSASAGSVDKFKGEDKDGRALELASEVTQS